MKVLFLSTNPKKPEKLRFNFEFKEIIESISVSKNRDKIDFLFRRAIKPNDYWTILIKKNLR